MPALTPVSPGSRPDLSDAAAAPPAAMNEKHERTVAKILMWQGQIAGEDQSVPSRYGDGRHWPEADAIEHLNMAVIVDQKRLGGGSHSTVGTITEIYTVLRLLFSRLGEPHVG